MGTTGMGRGPSSDGLSADRFVVGGRGALSGRRLGLPCIVAFALIALAAGLIAAGTAERADAAETFTVKSTGTAPDKNPGNGRCANKGGVCTLRAAIHEANSLEGPDTIQLPAGTYPISRPATEPNDIKTGDLDILDDLTIHGAGSSSTVIAGGRLDRVLQVQSPAASVNIDGVTIRAGSHPESGAGIMNSGAATVTVSRSVLQANRATKFGGGVANAQSGTIRLIDGTQLTTNSAGEAGSAVANLAAGTIEITQSTVSGNSSPGGGAISNTGSGLTEGAVRLLRTTVTGNVAGNESYPGGGVSNAGTGSITVDRSTVSDNRSESSGAGIANTGGGSLAVTLSTISGNSTAAGGEWDGGGISNTGEGTLAVTSSKVLDNVSTGEGGGIHSADKGGLRVSGSTISGNSALDGGGISTSGEAGALVTDSRLLGNKATQHGGGLNNNGAAGGALTVERVIFSGNQATGDGGGLILEGGAATIADSEFISNSAASGGGLANHSGGIVTLDDSKVSGNTASHGGGIDNRSNGEFTVTASEVSANRAERGGGISSSLDANFTVENATISGNVATIEGGGMLVLDPVTLASTTIAGNSAPVGGGIQKIGDSRLFVRNTIVANNPGGNCGYEPGTLPIESEGGNLDSGTSCGLTHPTDISGVNPLLGPLQDNGGPTRTRALDPASLAIDGAVSSTCPASDQRGVSRPQNAGCDMGSYEFEGVVPPPSCADRGTHLLSATEDSFVNEANAATNFGTDSALSVRSADADNSRALVRFDLPTLPSGCRVVAATLRLNNGSDAPDRALKAARLASSWTEQEVTWGNQPPTTGGVATAASVLGLMQWAVTGQVREIYSTGQNHGFMIRDAVESDSSSPEQLFNSREASSDPPQLVITLG